MPKFIFDSEAVASLHESLAALCDSINPEFLPSFFIYKNRFGVDLCANNGGGIPPTQSSQSDTSGEKNVNLYKNAFDKIGLGECSLSEIIRRIRGTEYKTVTDKLRSYPIGSKEASEYKTKNFTGVTFSGTFAPSRAKANLQRHTGLLCLDFDKLPPENFEAIKNKIQADLHTYICFISPSGNGLKVVVKLTDCKEEKKHLQYFLQLEKYYRETFGLQIDTYCKNVDRLCFLPCDENLYLNEVAKPFELLPTKEVKPKENAIQPTETSAFAWCLEQIQKSETFVKGNRNNFINRLAWYCNEKGVFFDDCLQGCLDRFVESDFTAQEIEATIKSVYHNHQDKFNSLPYEVRNQKKSVVGSKPKPQEKNFSIAESESQPRFIKIRNYLLSKYDLRLNIVSNDLLYKEREASEYHILNENDLQVELYELGFKGFDKELSALVKSSIVEKYNPFKDYFENLPAWNGTKDYITHLASFVRAKNQDFFNYHFKKMLVRVVAQALEVIPFNKHCFTLVGKQNDGKTSFLRFLTPKKLEEYTKENLEFDNKDGRFALYQNLFINLDELANFSKYDINKAKAFFTIDKVKDRLPFDRKPSTFPRRASFVASTNNKEFLTDETGNVRWLVFEIEDILHDNGGENGYAQKVNMDLVYSQAYALLKSGFKFQLSKDDIEQSEINNRNYQVSTPEMELLIKHYAPATKESNDDFVITSEILNTLSSWYPSLKLNPIMLGKALRFLGFEQSQKFLKECNYQQKGYYVKYLEKK